MYSVITLHMSRSEPDTKKDTIKNKAAVNLMDLMISMLAKTRRANTPKLIIQRSNLATRSILQCMQVAF